MRKLALKHEQLQNKQVMDEHERAFQRAREICRKEFEKPEVRAVFERLADK
ncbi:hypothetical protein [Helicobacter suis]|uniref:hypothetical protein n=1 Tax=Helicobacter suis TaxID=104628 RepID=UPI0013D0D3AE|nr:hypothetical protein [Helicobacter suis]